MSRSYIRRCFLYVFFFGTGLTLGQEDSGRVGMRLGINGGMYPEIEAGASVIHSITQGLDSLGMVWLRHPGKGTAWFEVQPAIDQWDWRKLDAVLEGNAHPWVIELYGQLGTVYPFGGFDRDVMEALGSKQAIMDYIKAHEVDMQDAVQRAHAEQYVKTFVSRYKAGREFWEIGNEGIGSSNRFDLVTLSYTWVKEVHPEARVMLTALVGDDENAFANDLAELDTLLSRGIGEYFDIANLHWYGRIGDQFEATLEQRVREYRALLERYELLKPIWVTETSTSSAENSVLSGPSSERIQARHAVIRPVVFFSMGVEKVFWHDYKETYSDNPFYQCNLIDPHTLMPKPSYHTYRLLVRKIGFFDDVETLRADDVRLYRFGISDGRNVFVAWSRGERVIDLSAWLQTSDALITHIIEEDGERPEETSVFASQIPVSESPVFIEEGCDCPIGEDQRSNLNPEMFTLGQNYPNPFNAFTLIPVFVMAPARVRLVVLDLLGREVASIFDGRLVAGNHTLRWEAEGHPGGLYFCRMEVGEFRKIRRLVLSK